MQEINLGENIIECVNPQASFLTDLRIDQRVMFYDSYQKPFIGTISSIASNAFVVSADTSKLQNISTQIFLYGPEVDDFLALNKDYLFTLNFAATQQIDRALQSTTIALGTLQARVDAQQSTIDSLVARLN
jgi:hypothetical protein